MKIGVLTSVGQTIDAFFPPLIDRWQELGHDVVTAAADPALFSKHTILSSLSRNPSIRNLRAPKEIAAWAGEEEIDVLITNTATASFLARIRKLPVPVVYFCHGLHWNEPQGITNRIWQGLELLALRKTDAAIVINDDDEAWFRQYLSQEKVHRLVGGVGVPIQDFPRSALPERNGVLRLIWAGEFTARKRPRLAVEVVERLLSENIKVHLTMCGDGPHMEDTQKLVENLGLTREVSLIGRSSEVPNLLSASHGLLMTSAWEGLPRIGLEAIAIGRPVFAFDVKGTRSLPDVMLASDGEVEELARLISKQLEIGLSEISFIDPSDLHPNRAADELINVANRLLS